MNKTQCYLKNNKIKIVKWLLIIIVLLAANVEIRKKFIASDTYVELENRGYNSSDIKNINIMHSYVNKILSYNEWRISVEFEEVPNIYFWFTYRNKQVIFQGVSSEPMMDKESVIEYSESFKKGKLLFEYGNENKANIFTEDVLEDDEFISELNSNGIHFLSNAEIEYHLSKEDALEIIADLIEFNEGNIKSAKVEQLLYSNDSLSKDIPVSVVTLEGVMVKEPNGTPFDKQALEYDDSNFVTKIIIDDNTREIINIFQLYNKT